MPRPGCQALQQTVESRSAEDVGEVARYLRFARTLLYGGNKKKRPRMGRFYWRTIWQEVGIHSGHPWPSPLRGGCAVQIGSLTAMDGGNAENAGAFFGLPICRTQWVLR